MLNLIESRDGIYVIDVPFEWTPFVFVSSGHVVERLSIDKIRFFRVERTYAVKTGKWYFEFEVVTGGDVRVGWARPGCKPDVELGTDDQAYVFDGHRVSCKRCPSKCES